jgi:hypothetical protein
MLGFFKKKNVVETLPIKTEVKKKTLEDKIVEICNKFIELKTFAFSTDFSEKQVMGAGMLMGKHDTTEKEAVFYIAQKGWKGHKKHDWDWDKDRHQLNRGRLDLQDEQKLASVFLYFCSDNRRSKYAPEVRILEKNYLQSPKFREFLVLLEEKIGVAEKQRQQEDEERKIKQEENRKAELKKEQEIAEILQQEWI